MTISEIYQDMLQPKDDGVLPELPHEYVNEILSNTVLIYLMPI